MAIIGTIQEKGRYFLVGFIGLALLTFIFTGTMKCSGPTILNNGTIDGEAVPAEKYSENIQRAIISDSMRVMQQEQRLLTEQEQQQSIDRAWSATVDELILDKEFEALGIDVSDKEFHAYLYGENGFTLMSDIQQGFADSVTGQFNPKALERFLEEKDRSKDAAELRQWEDTKKALRTQRKQEKYFQMLAQGVYVTKLEAKREYTAQREIKSVSFVVRNFRDISDDKVKITEAEIRAYYDKHKADKENEVMASREVRYFDIKLQPSGQDSTAFTNELNSLKVKFAVARNDSAFVVENTESQMRMPKMTAPYRAQGDPNAKGQTYPAYMDTVFKSAAVGTIVGPYSDQGKTYIAKITSFNTQSLNARHILLPARKDDKAGSAAQKKIADSLAAILNADKSRFEEFVNTYSTDNGSKAKGGKYDDFSKDEFVPEFSQFVIDNPVGKLGVVQTDFGFHIIEVLGKKDARIPVLAVIEKTLLPSTETQDGLKDKAYDIMYQIENKISKTDDVVKKLELFDTIARKEGFFARPVRMMDEAPRAQGFNTRPAETKIVELAFNESAKEGDVCSSPISDGERYIIAIVASIHTEDGEPSFQDVYQKMRTKAINEKKAKIILGQIGKTRDLNKLAGMWNGQVVNAEITFANPSIQGGSYEPEIVGSLFSALQDGKMTLPLVGEAGVYLFKLNKTVKAPAAASYDAERKQMAMQIRQSQQQDLMGALRKKSKVYDNRMLRDLNIAR